MLATSRPDESASQAWMINGPGRRAKTPRRRARRDTHQCGTDSPLALDDKWLNFITSFPGAHLRLFNFANFGLSVSGNLVRERGRERKIKQNLKKSGREN